MKIGSTYRNFQDPFGLVLRMLRSGDRAARFALYRDTLQLCLRPIDLLMQTLDARRIRETSPSSLPLIFVVGPPRSGTTLVYQFLARYLPVTYFTNFSALFRRAPLSASVLFGRFLATGRAEFHSYYGNAAGLAAPNDGFHVWNRWLGEDRYTVPERLGEADIEGMRRFFSAWTATFGRPFLNKNNRNAFAIELLSAALDNVRFIEVRRDPVYVAQSLLIARERIQGSRTIAWGLGAMRSGEPVMSPLEDVAEQVAYVSRRIEEQKRKVGAERFIEIPYERFCDDPAAYLQEIYARIWGEAPKLGDALGEIEPFKPNNEPQLPAAEFEQLRALVQQRL